jgi:catechol 2,3-dioxygenase-like lactoylglutathione lyase family enzyme
MTGDGNAVGDLYLATVVLNVQDMRRAVDFWCAALGYQPRETEWDPSFMMLVHPEGRGTPVSLQLADRGPAEPVRVHLDLTRASRAATSSASSTWAPPG